MTLTRRQLFAWCAQVDAETASRAAFDAAVETAINGLRRTPRADLCEQVEQIFSDTTPPFPSLSDGGGTVARFQACEPDGAAPTIPTSDGQGLDRPGRR